MPHRERVKLWTIGDRAIHVDGGPEMEVTGTDGRTVWCRWEAEGRSRTRVLPAEEVLRVWDDTSLKGRVVSLSVGSRVTHLFGGPAMTITEIEGSNAWCQWSAASHPQSRQFPCSELVEAPAPVNATTN